VDVVDRTWGDAAIRRAGRRPRGADVDAGTGPVESGPAYGDARPLVGTLGVKRSRRSNPSGAPVAPVRGESQRVGAPSLGLREGCSCSVERRSGPVTGRRGRLRGASSARPGARRGRTGRGGDARGTDANADGSWEDAR
jgi:hypothetical protein